MKKVLVMFISALFLFSLAGCGSNPVVNEAGAGTTTNQETPASSSADKPPVSFPEKPITVINPYAAGGGTDIVLRALASATEKHLGQPLVVVNKTGGGGAVGMTEGANAKADGYTVTMITLALSMFPHQDLAPISYKDFKPIAKINEDAATVIVSAESPFQTLQELLDYAKQHPGELKVGNSGSGMKKDLAGLTVERAAGVEFNHVRFEGAAPTIAAILGGHIDLMTVTLGEALPQIKAGQLRPLAVLSDKRSQQVPDVPTYEEETGTKIDSVGPWRGIGVPKDTPDEIVSILEEAFMKGAAEEDFVKLMNDNALDLDVQDSKQFAEFLKTNYESFEALFEELKAEP